MAGPVVDAAGALALASARGVAPDLAAELITAAINGVMLGAAEREKGREEGEGEETTSGDAVACATGAVLRRTACRMALNMPTTAAKPISIAPAKTPYVP